MAEAHAEKRTHNVHDAVKAAHTPAEALGSVEIGDGVVNDDNVASHSTPADEIRQRVDNPPESRQATPAITTSQQPLPPPGAPASMTLDFFTWNADQAQAEGFASVGPQADHNNSHWHNVEAAGQEATPGRQHAAIDTNHDENCPDGRSALVKHISDDSCGNAAATAAASAPAAALPKFGFLYINPNYVGNDVDNPVPQRLTDAPGPWITTHQRRKPAAKDSTPPAADDEKDPFVDFSQDDDGLDERREELRRGVEAAAAMTAQRRQQVEAVLQQEERERTAARVEADAASASAVAKAGKRRRPEGAAAAPTAVEESDTVSRRQDASASDTVMPASLGITMHGLPLPSADGIYRTAVDGWGGQSLSQAPPWETRQPRPTVTAETSAAAAEVVVPLRKAHPPSVLRRTLPGPSSASRGPRFESDVLTDAARMTASSDTEAALDTTDTTGGHGVSNEASKRRRRQQPSNRLSVSDRRKFHDAEGPHEQSAVDFGLNSLVQPPVAVQEVEKDQQYIGHKNAKHQRHSFDTTDAAVLYNASRVTTTGHNTLNMANLNSAHGHFDRQHSSRSTLDANYRPHEYPTEDNPQKRARHHSADRASLHLRSNGTGTGSHPRHDHHRYHHYNHYHRARSTEAVERLNLRHKSFHDSGDHNAATNYQYAEVDERGEGVADVPRQDEVVTLGPERADEDYSKQDSSHSLKRRRATAQSHAQARFAGMTAGPDNCSAVDGSNTASRAFAIQPGDTRGVAADNPSAGSPPFREGQIAASAIAEPKLQIASMPLTKTASIHAQRARETLRHRSRVTAGTSAHIATKPSSPVLPPKRLTPSDLPLADVPSLTFPQGVLSTMASNIRSLEEGRMRAVHTQGRFAPTSLPKQQPKWMSAKSHAVSQVASSTSHARMTTTASADVITPFQAVQRKSVAASISASSSASDISPLAVTMTKSSLLVAGTPPWPRPQHTPSTAASHASATRLHKSEMIVVPQENNQPMLGRIRGNKQRTELTAHKSV